MSGLDSWRRMTDLARAVALAAGLERHDGWTRARLAAWQRARLLRIVRHAAANVPLYRALYRGLDLGDALDPRQLPTIGKQRLMQQFDASVADPRLRRDALERHLAQASGDALYLGEYRVVATAGTSGLRGLFVYDRAAWRVVIANTLRWQRFAGIGPTLPRRTRICTIGADSAMHVTSRIPMSGNVGLFQLALVQANAPIAAQVATLNSFQPDVLLPYPSMAALLAREQLAGRLAIHPRVIATHSELLTPEMARIIEAAWGSRPLNHYGATEEPHVAIECTRHAGMHVLEDTSLVEPVDDDLRPVPPGQTATRWLLTNLYNFAQPLIRYEMTDVMRLSATPCPCGRPFGLIGEIGGRAEDLLHLPRSGGAGSVSVSPMLISLAIESFLGVREYAAEHDADGIRIRLVVPDPDARAQVQAELAARIRRDIVTQGAVPPDIQLSFLSGLDRSAERMGKHSVVGHSRRPPVAAPDSGASK